MKSKDQQIQTQSETIDRLRLELGGLKKRVGILQQMVDWFNAEKTPRQSRALEAAEKLFRDTGNGQESNN